MQRRCGRNPSLSDMTFPCPRRSALTWTSGFTRTAGHWDVTMHGWWNWIRDNELLDLASSLQWIHICFLNSHVGYKLSLKPLSIHAILISQIQTSYLQLRCEGQAHHAQHELQPNACNENKTMVGNRQTNSNTHWNLNSIPNSKRKSNSNLNSNRLNPTNDFNMCQICVQKSLRLPIGDSKMQCAGLARRARVQWWRAWHWRSANFCCTIVLAPILNCRTCSYFIANSSSNSKMSKWNSNSS